MVELAHQDVVIVMGGEGSQNEFDRAARN